MRGSAPLCISAGTISLSFGLASACAGRAQPDSSEVCTVVWCRNHPRHCFSCSLGCMSWREYTIPPCMSRAAGSHVTQVQLQESGSHPEQWLDSEILCGRYSHCPQPRCTLVGCTGRPGSNRTSWLTPSMHAVSCPLHTGGHTLILPSPLQGHVGTYWHAMSTRGT